MTQAQTSNTPVVPGSFSTVEPRCKVCTSPHRREIDMMLAMGWSQASVINHWNGYLGEEHFKRDGMSTHTRKHLSVRDAGVVKVIEERARQEGLDTQLIEGFILTKTAVAENVIMAGLEAMHRGDTEVRPGDILKAIEILKQLEISQADALKDRLMEEMAAFMAAVKKNAPPELWGQIYEDYEIGLGKKPLPIASVSVEEEV